mgnify:CR=1 FL=1
MSESSTSIKFSLLNSFPNEPGDWGDLSFFDKKMDLLSDYDVADCLFRAALVGNEMLMRRLVEYRGPVQVEFVNEHPAKSFKLNGEPILGASIPTLGGVHTPAALKSLLKAIDELGMKGLIDHGPTFPALFRKLNTNSDYKLMKTVRFDGEIPLVDRTSAGESRTGPCPGRRVCQHLYAIGVQANPVLGL